MLFVQVDDVEVNPILIQKGLTKLALYGMGSMRDERLNRMWQQKKASLFCFCVHAKTACGR